MGNGVVLIGGTYNLVRVVQLSVVVKDQPWLGLRSQVCLGALCKGQRGGGLP
jgi:hypothetical protein